RHADCFACRAAASAPGAARADSWQLLRSALLWRIVPAPKLAGGVEPVTTGRGIAGGAWTILVGRPATHPRCAGAHHQRAGVGPEPFCRRLQRTNRGVEHRRRTGRLYILCGGPRRRISDDDVSHALVSGCAAG